MAFFKFKNRKSLLEIAQKILIFQHLVLRSGFDGCMFVAKFAQAAMGSCMGIRIVQKRNGGVP